MTPVSGMPVSGSISPNPSWKSQCVQPMQRVFRLPAHRRQPVEARLPRRVIGKHAELVDDDRLRMPCAPVAPSCRRPAPSRPRSTAFPATASRTVVAASCPSALSSAIFAFISGSVGARRKRQAAQIADRIVGAAPVRALMRERERIVVVDRIDDVAVAERFQVGKRFVPLRSGRADDDRVVEAGCA